MLAYSQSVFGIILGLLLVFRSNRAYERWWEARTLWGQLINTSRNLAIKIKVLMSPDPQEAKEFADLIIAFCKVLSIHLRRKHTEESFEKYLPPGENPEHVPSYIATKLYQKIHPQAMSLREINRLFLDNDFTQLMNICGGCERIRNTYISLSFRVFVKHVFIVFILVLPYSLVESLGIWAIPATILISYLLTAIEGIARNLEEPFGLTEDHLHLNSFTKTIKTSVNQILLGE